LSNFNGGINTTWLPLKEVSPLIIYLNYNLNITRYRQGFEYHNTDNYNFKLAMGNRSGETAKWRVGLEYRRSDYINEPEDPPDTGFVVFATFDTPRDNESLDVHRVHVPSGLFAAVVHPKVEVLTRSARSILSEQVALEKHIRQSGDLGGLLIGLFQSDFELISRSLHDHIIEPQRAKLIPHFDSVKEKAMEAGALGCSISGAGPSVFALCSNSLLARQVGQAMESAFRDRGLDCELFVSGINAEGAKKC
jgi:homoserine kinase